MTDEPDAVEPDVDPDTDPRSEERPRAGHGRPVDDGPGQHHANANTRRSPTQQSRLTHEF